MTPYLYSMLVKPAPDVIRKHYSPDTFDIYQLLPVIYIQIKPLPLIKYGFIAQLFLYLIIPLNLYRFRQSTVKNATTILLSVKN